MRPQTPSGDAGRTVFCGGVAPVIAWGFGGRRGRLIAAALDIALGVLVARTGLRRVSDGTPIDGVLGRSNVHESET
jgi:hypothetical protein